jgi:hypothetical protein
MGLFNLIRKAAALTEHDRLSEQLSQNKARGLDDLEARGVLIHQTWSLPKTPDAVARAALLSHNVGEFAIGLLMFSKRIGVSKAMKLALLDDQFFKRHGCLYGAAVPMTDFARKHMNLIWSRQRLDPADASDAGFAAYYATLVAPIAVDAWLMLAELRQLGFCPEIDRRDHAREGVASARKFLESARDAEPEFCRLLNEGITHLSRMAQT